MGLGSERWGWFLNTQGLCTKCCMRVCVCVSGGVSKDIIKVSKDIIFGLKQVWNRCPKWT